MILEQILPTSDYERFDGALSAFLRTPEAESAPPHAAAFACAGPVKNDCCKFTNISWVVDKEEVERDFGIPCRVLNDFEGHWLWSHAAR
jgi:glucokinase